MKTLFEFIFPNYAKLSLAFNIISKKSLFQKIILIILIIFFSSQITFSLNQSQHLKKITGYVTDASTEKPIVLANVFLTNTTFGSITNEAGAYCINNIPIGSYELVVSVMGYELQKKTIHLNNFSEKTYNFNLNPTVLPGEEVSVTAKYPKEWKKNLKIFERIFFGEKEFAKKCKITNPEVLDFEYDRKSGQFKAFAEKPIIFINKALGYEVTFFLDQFKAKLYDGNISGIERLSGHGVLVSRGSRSWSGTTFFKTLHPKNKKEKKKWGKNRKKAYNGSKRHFFKVLCEDKLKDEGFEICGAERPRSSWEHNLNSKDILKHSSNPSQFILFFPDYLKVTYKNETDDISYDRWVALRKMQNTDLESMDRWRTEMARKYMYQHSWIKIDNKAPIIIDTSGLVLSANERLSVVFGYWRYHSAAEWLPIEYKPPEK